MFEATSTVTHPPQKELTFLARLLPKSLAPQSTGWPNPEASIGQYRSTFNGQKFWEIIDPGRKELAPLLPAVKSLLDAHNEDLKERETVPILFALFMVGRTEVIACPTLVIICSKKGPRQKVADLIRTSEVLHKYPGVLLGTSSKHPRIPASGPPQSVASGMESGVQSSNQSDRPIYVKKSEFRAACGDPIYIPVDDDSKIQESCIFRRATIGGYLKLKARDGMITVVGITVAHAFEPPHQDTNVPQSTEESDSEDSVFGFDGPSPEDLSNQSSSLIKMTKSFFSNKSQSSQRSSSPEEIPSMISEEIPINKFEIQDISSLEQIGTLYKASANDTSNVDWALVRITDQRLLVSNILHIPAEHIAPHMESSSEKSDIEVMTCTASKKSYTGSLCLSPTFLRMEDRKVFEEVLTVKLDGRIEHGDSGSWMIQKENLRLYGHIVAGDPGSGLAYIMPGRRLFQDIEFQLGSEVALYSQLEVKPEDGNQERQSESHLEASTLDTAILTPKLREHVPERDGEILVFSPKELAQRNEYFVPRDGIDVDVITADLTLYLGNDVLLRTGSFQSITTGVVQLGYFVTAFRSLKPVKSFVGWYLPLLMQHLPQGEINDLKTDTKKWEVERQPAEYRSSTTHQYRTRYGPTEEGYQYDWSSSGSGLPRAYDTGISAQRNFASAQSYSSTYAPSQGLIYTVQRYNAAGGPSDP